MPCICNYSVQVLVASILCLVFVTTVFIWKFISSKPKNDHTTTTTTTKSWDYSLRLKEQQKVNKYTTLQQQQQLQQRRRRQCPKNFPMQTPITLLSLNQKKKRQIHHVITTIPTFFIRWQLLLHNGRKFEKYSNSWIFITQKLHNWSVIAI